MAAAAASSSSSSSSDDGAPKLSNSSPANMCDECFDCFFVRHVARPHTECKRTKTPRSKYDRSSYQPDGVAAMTACDAKEASQVIAEAVNASASVSLDMSVQGLGTAVLAAIRWWMQVLTFSGRTTVAQVAGADPVAEFAGRPAECWKAHGWALIPPTDKTRQLAAELDDWVEQTGMHTLRSELYANRRQSLIAGGVVQTTIEGDGSSPTELGTGDQFAAALRELGSDAVKRVAPDFDKHIKGARYMGTKVLVSSEGAGMQPIHWDSPRWQSEDKPGCAITVLFFGKDCDTTLLPAYTADRFTVDMDQLLLMARVELLNKRLFCSASVKAGTMLLFRHSVPHAGVTCTADRRIVLFDTLTSEPKGLNIEDQYFEWNYIRDAFGARSPEYEASLRKNIKLGHQPVERESEKESAALKAWLAIGRPSDNKKS